jgi:hypothetical protein
MKPSLQHFQFCRVGLSLGILYLSILHNNMLGTVYQNMIKEICKCNNMNEIWVHLFEPYEKL